MAELTAFQDNSPVRYKTLLDLCNNHSELRLYLWKSGLLGDFSGSCMSCGVGNVHLVKCVDNYFWRCGARKCKKKFSIRKNSFFEGSHLSFKTILCLIYCWIYELPFKFVRVNLEISDHTIVDWYNFCRDVCVDILLFDNKKIGGPSHIVEIDESKFGKRKFNVGRRVDGCWVGSTERQEKLSSRLFQNVVLRF